jgi:hypothetical protein
MQPTDDGREHFDLNLSDENSDSSEEYIPPPRSSNTPATAASSTLGATQPATLAAAQPATLAALQPVLAPPSHHSSRNMTAHDINHFFA